jgi:2'-5' RNA ligase
MSDQFALPGLDAPPTDRLFFGVYPPEPVAERIGVLAQSQRAEHGLIGRPHATERFHITLVHLGDFAGLPKDMIAKAEAAAASLKLRPFEVSFDRAASFSGKSRNRPYVLQGDEGVVAVKAMRQALVTALAETGLGKWANSPFTPHVTLLYDDRAVPEQPIEPIGWTAGEFVLVHSLLGKTQHIPLNTWALGG